jgi:hypothetical protein
MHRYYDNGMARSTVSPEIVLLTLATAVIHAYLNVLLGQLDIIMTGNALGYLALLVALTVPALAAYRRTITWVFIGYTLITIAGWVAIGDKSFNTTLGLIGWVDKLIEVGLVGALVRSLRKSFDSGM